MSSSLSLTPAQVAELADAIAERVASRLADRPRYLDREAMARDLGVSVPTLDRWTRSGRIPASRIGGRVLYAPADVHAALRAPAIAAKGGTR